MDAPRQLAEAQIVFGLHIGVISDTMTLMATLDDIIEQMRRAPQNVRFAEACAVADAFFGKPRQHGTSHRVWKMPWMGDPRVNMQEGKGGKAKAYQVEQLLNAVDQLRAQGAMAKAEREAKAKAEQEVKRTKGQGRSRKR
jgi:hypothetical protein